MCLGKAWTSLPCCCGGLSGLQTPLQLWLETCRTLFQGIPAGTVVIVASDTLLQLNTNSIRLEQQEQRKDDTDDDSGSCWTTILGNPNRSTILGLAVPAPVTTAKNHGVFVLQQEEEDDNNPATSNHHKSPQIHPCRKVLQKPTLDALTECRFALPQQPDDDDDDNEDNNNFYAWIDTGVTILSPAAATAFRTLARDHLPRCTATGLRALFAEQQQQQPCGDDEEDANDNMEYQSRRLLPSECLVRRPLHAHYAGSQIGAAAAVDPTTTAKRRRRRTSQKKGGLLAATRTPQQQRSAPRHGHGPVGGALGHHAPGLGRADGTLLAPGHDPRAAAVLGGRHRQQ